ncbi:DUF4920 domain-containing protein [Dokdonella koreensis]|uniref:DUF4920 domain-containing protein n=1 Tax=Dokdonella koreensis DS-123 TaxID=1300342 RepID=A0A160DTU1_9GAMM|nr:DUF4920 domain-containing protein [Dokdonella koreensis]ANB17818.1 Hypothetical protein I596_1794 [Dokdonella koreensis DS-123]
MRTPFALVLSLLLAGGACAHEGAHDGAGHGGGVDHDRTPAGATPVQQTEAGAVYGAPLAAAPATAVSIDDAHANLTAQAGKDGAWSGRITQVCQKMGCWLVLTGEGDRHARVFMHDHAYSVPKDASGQAIVYGTLSEKKLDAKEVQHLKDDGAKAPAERELQIDARSVLILKAA